MRYNPLPWILAVAAVVGVIWFSAWHHGAAQSGPEAPAHSARLSHRAASAAVTAQTRRVGANELVMLDIPVLEDPDPFFAQSRRCYVWRDLEFRTSTITCPNDPQGGPADAPSVPPDDHP